MSSLLDTILGRPLASNEAGEQRIGAAEGVPTFGLDAISSAAYGPEAALTVLLPLGALGLSYILPITIAIVILLAIVFLSYWQTIAAYPTGGGSYTVARENLGVNPSLLAAASLMTDYVLNVAVGISAGVGARFQLFRRCILIRLRFASGSWRCSPWLICGASIRRARSLCCRSAFS